MALPQMQNIVAVQGFSFNGNGLNSAIAFVPLKDFSERKGEEDSAQAISAKATQSLLFRSEENTSELQSLMRNSYAVFYLNKKKTLSTLKHNHVIVNHTH